MLKKSLILSTISAAALCAPIATKEQYLETLEKPSLDALWIQFLKIQSDLFFEKEFAALFNQHCWERAENILEIGSGNGDLLAKLQKAFPDKNYVGLEQQAAAVFRAQTNFPSIRFLENNAEVFVGDFSSLFDVVIFRLTLQHLKQPKVALEHAFRYLKKGGLVFIIDSHDASRTSSLPTPILDKAVEELNEKNREQGKGNRQITLEIQQELRDCVCYSNLDDHGADVPRCPQIVLHNLGATPFYRDYYLLFLQILNKGWGISIDFEKAYDEIEQFMNDPSSWQRSGKHILLLEKK